MSRISLSTKIFFSSLTAFIFGLVFCFLGFSLLFSLLGFLVIFILLYFLFSRDALFLALAFLPFFALGFWRYEVTFFTPTTTDISYYNDDGTTHDLVGTVHSFPSIRDDSQNIDLLVSSMDGQDVTGLVRVSMSKYPTLLVGDELSVSAEILSPQNFEDFDYKSYLAKENIYSVIYYPSFELVGEAGDLRSRFLRPFNSLQNSFNSLLQKIYPEPESSLVTALTSGVRSRLSDSINDSFKATGITHLVALSGLNIALVLFILNLLFSFLPYRPKIILEIIGLIFFTIFVGATPSIVRACIMGVIALFAMLHARKSDTVRAILLAGFIMLLLSPRLLFYDVSFQLSFLATLGIIFIHPLLYPYLKFIPDKFSLREIISLTLSSQLAVLPLLVYNFGGVSLISPVTNVLVLPVSTLIIVFGFISAFFALFSILLGKLTGIIAYISSAYIIKVAELTAAIPYAFLSLNLKSHLFTAVYYLLLIGLVLVLPRRNPSSDQEKPPHQV